MCACSSADIICASVSCTSSLSALLNACTAEYCNFVKAASLESNWRIFKPLILSFFSCF